MKELDAINTVLDAIGVYPVTSVDSPHPDAVRARQLLKKHTTTILSRGWWFNREYDLVLSPVIISKKVLVPANTLVVDSCDKVHNYIQRGIYVYDMTDHTFEFDEPIHVHIVYDLLFEDVPPVAQDSITADAAVNMATTREGDQNKIKILDRDSQVARSLLITTDLANSNYNVFKQGMPLRMISGMRPAMIYGR